MSEPTKTNDIKAESESRFLQIAQRKDFLFGVCGASAFLSFCTSLYRVRKTARKYSTQAVHHTTEVPEMFATKALAMGTVVAVSSFTLFWWCIFKVLGTNNGMTELDITLTKQLSSVEHRLKDFIFKCEAKIRKKDDNDDIYEFHAKLRTYFPEKEKKGRTEFANLRELADFLISEDRKAELEKKKKLAENSTPKES